MSNLDIVLLLEHIYLKKYADLPTTTDGPTICSTNKFDYAAITGASEPSKISLLNQQYTIHLNTIS